MKIVIITPTWQNPSPYLDGCIQSVQAQSYKNIKHIIVNDGAKPFSIPGIEVINLPKRHNDWGNTPRYIGGLHAMKIKADAIAWLDDDNWFEPNHIESLVNILSKGASVASSTRNLFDLNDNFIGLCYEIDAVNFVDCNCWLIGKEAFHLIHKWNGFKNKFNHTADRFIWDEILRMVKDEGTLVGYSGQPTVGYRTSYRVHYKKFNLIPPLNSK